jgi:hypothetical protein
MNKGEDGHVHVLSRYFSATDVSRDGPWGWSHPYSYLILHPGMLLGDFNGDPTMRKLIVDLADGHLAHGKQDPDGTWRYPEDINAATGQSRGELTGKGRGNVAVMQLFWAAWRWTGDEKYLRPLKGEIAHQAGRGLDELNSDVIDMLGLRAQATPMIKDDGRQGLGRSVHCCTRPGARPATPPISTGSTATRSPPPSNGCGW